VGFLRSRPRSPDRPGDGGDLQLRQLLTEIEQGRRIELAFVRAYGRSLAELALEWRQDLPGRFVWYPLLASGGLPLMLVAPLVLVGWLRRRRAYHRGLRRLADQEADELARPALVAPAF
jgi:hypothetical protein